MFVSSVLTVKWLDFGQWQTCGRELCIAVNFFLQAGLNFRRNICNANGFLCSPNIDCVSGEILPRRTSNERRSKLYDRTRAQITLNQPNLDNRDLDTSEFSSYKDFRRQTIRNASRTRPNYTTLAIGMPAMHSFSHDFPLHALNQKLSRSKQDRGTAVK